MKYAAIQYLRRDYPVRLICLVLMVSASGFYAWVKRQKEEQQSLQAPLKVAILTLHRKSHETYGAERIHAALRRNGMQIGLWTVKKLRRQMGLRCRQKRHGHVHGNTLEQVPASGNVLNRRFHPDNANQVWLSDITYIRTREGWLYLAGIKDACTKEIVGYAFSRQMTASLVMNALRHAWETRRPGAGLLLHSDQGGQYRSVAYARLLKKYNITCSMSRRGNCYDNAPMESFWGLLKTEWLRKSGMQSMESIEESVKEYIEIFYNRIRIQKGLGFQSPSAYASRKRG